MNGTENSDAKDNVGTSGDFFLPSPLAIRVSFLTHTEWKPLSVFANILIHSL